ncbi:MAG TPA: hypothetical protein VEX60_18505 [Pyrinomonadaceae bacterium]|nr:hypothetical protein [Pyrinomonadaceae bacterium]
MKNAARFLTALAVCLTLAAGASAQRTRTVSEPATTPVQPATTPTQQDQDPVQKTKVPVPPAPPKAVPAKYMGGFAGYRKKQEGMLTFDDRNRRLVFRDKNEKEILSISYEAVMVAFADHETRRLAGDGTRAVLGAAGVFGLPGLLFKKKFEYLTIQFEDPDTYLKGTTQFKLKDKEIIDSVVYALAQKANLAQQGEIFTRKRTTTTIPVSDDKTANP